MLYYNCQEGNRLTDAGQAEKGERMNEMTAKEILNLIDWLREQGFDNDKIVECIEAIEGKKEKAD